MKHELFTYLLEASVILIVLGLFYWVFFRKLTFYQVNRSLVILTVVAAMFMPFIQVDINSSSSLVLKDLGVPAISFRQNSDTIGNDQVNGEVDRTEVISAGNIQSEVVEQNSGFDWYLLIGAVYLLGVIFTVCRLAFSLLKFYQMRKTATYYQLSQHYVISEKGHSFSFFNWIFIDSETMESDEYQVVLKHEKVHARLFHSLDVLLFELGKAIFWFNPLIYLLAKESRLVNEFHTDQMVVREEGLEVYSNTLINYQQNLFKRNGALLVANSFAQLSLKPRVMQLVKKPSCERSKLSYLSLLPIFIVLFAVVSCDLKDEPLFDQNIKSMKAYYYDEFGDQQQRSGKLILDLSLNPDGSFAGPRLSLNKHSYLQQSLQFINWNTEAYILEHKNKWPELRQNSIENIVDKHFSWKDREGITIDKESPEGRVVSISSRVIREKDADGFETLRIEESDQDGKVWSTFYIDSGQLYEYDELGRINAVRYKVFDDEAYMEKKGESLADIKVVIDRRSFTKPARYDFSYDTNGNIETSRLNGKLSKTFQYDDNNRLIKINRYKNETLASYYQLNYNDKGHFSEVTAYNGAGGLEFTAKYEYQYY